MHGDGPTLPESPDEALLRAGFRDDDDARALIRTHLGARDPRLRVLALRGGLRQSLLDEEDWLRALADPDLDVRREALDLVAQAPVADQRIFDAMLERLHDADALVVDGAIFALGEHLYVEAVVPLAQIARDHEDARCRESAVAALGALGDDRGRAAVLNALDDRAPVRRRAIVALTNFVGPDIDAALERAAQDRDWQVRAAVSQLGREED